MVKMKNIRYMLLFGIAFVLLLGYMGEMKKVKADEGWQILLKDSNEANSTINLKEILVRNDGKTLFFKVIFYAPWYGDPHNYIDVGIFLDTDQNNSTGLNNQTGWYYMDDIGADYVAVIGWEGDSLWKWNESNESWELYQNFSYLYLENSTYYFEVGINLTSIGMPNAIDIMAISVDVNKNWYWDYAPDAGQGHATYFLNMSFSHDSWKKGYVYDSSGNPIEGAYVEIYSDETHYWNETITNDTGYFEFFISHGNYSIEVNAYGYEPYYENFSIGENETLWNYIYLNAVVSYPDSYEPDNNASDARWIACNGTEQTHNFHVAGDEDWIKFNATSGATYIIETSNLGPDCDTYIYLYDSNLTLIAQDDDGGTRLASRIVWNCSMDGIYYVMIRDFDSYAYGNDTYYNISIKEIVPDSWKKGYVYDSSGNPIEGAYVEIYSDETHYWNETITNDTGYFEFFISHGNYSIEVNAYGYEPYYENFSIGENETLWNYIYLNAVVSYPDSYEPDNNASDARWIACNGTEQTHNFHVAGDEDWIKFNATSGATYIIETSNLGPDCDTYIYLYDSNLTLIAQDDDGGTRLASRIVWNCSMDGIYYVMIRDFDSYAYGNDTYYNISIKEIIPYTFVNVSPNYQKVIKNDTFTINITIAPSMPVTGIGFDLLFNASLVEVIDVEKGNMLNGYSTYFNNGSIDNTNGSIKNIQVTVVNGSIDASGAIVRIIFIAKGVGISFLNLTNVAVIASNVSLPIATNNGSVEIIWAPWDLNHDGDVNVLDLIVVAMHFGSHEGEAGYAKMADLNGDGEINVLDLIAVAMHWTG